MDTLSHASGVSTRVLMTSAPSRPGWFMHERRKSQLLGNVHVNPLYPFPSHELQVTLFWVWLPVSERLH